jgi:hypothetical protein
VRRVGDGGFLESIVESFAFGDLQRLTQTLIIGAEAEQATDESFVSAVPFARPRKRAMELKDGRLRSAAHKTAGEKTEATGARRMRRGGADHYWSDDVEQAYQIFCSSGINYKVKSTSLPLSAVGLLLRAVSDFGLKLEAAG